MNLTESDTHKLFRYFDADCRCVCVRARCARFPFFI